VVSEGGASSGWWKGGCLIRVEGGPCSVRVLTEVGPRACALATAFCLRVDSESPSASPGIRGRMHRAWHAERSRSPACTAHATRSKACASTAALPGC